jgi:pimeloyl-ACP methyl ester carboxylesterase
MQVVLVHGLGRTRFSLAGLARHLRRAGHATEIVGYVAAREPFARIRDRVRARLLASATRGPYAAIGHSLGGLLLRAALEDYPPEAALPALLVTLGTPTRPPRLARRLRDLWFYRRLAGECGQLLADPAFLASLNVPPVPYTAIAGTRGWPRYVGPFRDAPNDGVVALDETTTVGSVEHLHVPAFHTFLMDSRAVQVHICERLSALARPPNPVGVSGRA